MGGAKWLGGNSITIGEYKVYNYKTNIIFLSIVGLISLIFRSWFMVLVVVFIIALEIPTKKENELRRKYKNIRGGLE